MMQLSKELRYYWEGRGIVYATDERFRRGTFYLLVREQTPEVEFSWDLDSDKSRLKTVIIKDGVGTIEIALAKGFAGDGWGSPIPQFDWTLVGWRTMQEGNLIVETR